MTGKRSGGAAGLRVVAYVLFFAGLSLIPRPAAAEKVVSIVDGWQVYTDGRMGGFASYTRGDGYPQPTYDYAIDPATGQRAIDPGTGNPMIVSPNTPRMPHSFAASATTSSK